jgi:hypothetical protein
MDQSEFIQRGDTGTGKRLRHFEPELQTNVEQQIKRIMDNGGKLIIE